MNIALTRRFHLFMGLAMSAIVLFGFSRTYFFKAWFDTPQLTLRLHLHGLALTLWLGLFILQARLVAAGRRRLHMSVGAAGIVLAALVVVFTYVAAIEAARLGGRAGITPVDRMFSSVLVASLFGLFVGLGAAYRKRPDIHKRLMLLATIAVIGPGVTRAVVLLLGHPIRDSHIAVESTLFLLALIYDWRTRGRPHWVLVSGGLLLIVSQATRRLIGGSESWAQIGNWLIQ